MAAKEITPLRYDFPGGWAIEAGGIVRKKTGEIAANLILRNSAPRHVERIILTDVENRATFAGQAFAATGGDPTAPSETELKEALLTIAGEAVIASEATPDQSPTQAADLVSLVGDAELWHTPEGDPYATIAVADHREHWPLNGSAFKDWLTHQYYRERGKVPGRQALQDAITTLAGRARFDGAEHPVYVRLAEHSGAFYIDLGNDRWETVQINPALPQGWRIASDPPVRFRRPRGMLSLPSPEPGGTIDALRPFLNCGEGASGDDNWRLFVAWLLAALRPDRPMPVIALHGEQGSAKSTTTKVLRALVDPNTTPLRHAPRDARDIAIAAKNGWIVAYDNLSALPVALSDTLCMLSTGGGFGTRALYTDDDEALFTFLRPVILNGIEDLATRPDLLERTIVRQLPMIPDSARRDETAYWAAFYQERPALLGALFSTLARMIALLPEVRLARKPRMADFALWMAAAEQALGWGEGTILNAYDGNQATAHELALETSSVASALVTFMAARDSWQGTMQDLLAELGYLVGDRTVRSQEWPATPRKLSGVVRRYETNLRAIGISVAYGKDSTHTKRRIVSLSKSTKG